MTDMIQELKQLKQSALDATQRADGDFYMNYLADEAIAITPRGVLDKAAIVQAMSMPDAPFKSLGIKDERYVQLSEDVGIVIYKASYASGDVYTSTVYKRYDGTLKGVVYQQTPIA